MKKEKTFKMYRAHKGPKGDKNDKLHKEIGYNSKDVYEETEKFMIVNFFNTKKVEPKNGYVRTKKQALINWVAEEEKRIEKDYKKEIKYAQAKHKNDTDFLIKTKRKLK